MRAYSLNELFNLTRAELFALHTDIASELAALPEGSEERVVALSNLRCIRRVLAHPNSRRRNGARRAHALMRSISLGSGRCRRKLDLPAV